MTEWIDLSLPNASASIHQSGTLCESRIARVVKQAVGAFAHSKLRARVARAFTPATLDSLCWLLTFAAGMASGSILTIAILLGRLR